MARTISILNKLAQEKGENPNRLKAIFALERIVARLESDPRLSQSLVYKGGYVLYKTTDTNRLTRDVDALAHGLSPEEAGKLTIEALAINLFDDIYYHDPKTLELETTGEYGGLRVDVAYSINEAVIKPEKVKKLSRVHFDIGFGSFLPDEKEKESMKLVLDKAGLEVSWSVLPLEYIFAEKLQTLIIRGDQNSRGKDIYDMWFISEKLTDLPLLKNAINRVFKDRNTEVPVNFTKHVSGLNFAILRSSWKAILFSETSTTFDEAMAGLMEFLKKI